MSAVADKLAEARKLIEAGWTQDAYARGKSGREVDPLGRGGVCYCAAGAIMHAENCGIFVFSDGFHFLKRAIGGGNVYDWNDHRKRTQAEVIAAFHEAETLAREEASK